MTSRGMISARQRTNSYRPSGAIAQHILDATISGEVIEQHVIQCRANQPILAGSLLVLPGEQFYRIASTKFIGRFYVAVLRKGVWSCSAKDAEICQQCIEKAKAYRAELIARIVMNPKPVAKLINSDDYIPTYPVEPHETTWYEC